MNIPFPDLNKLRADLAKLTARDVLEWFSAYDLGVSRVVVAPPVSEKPDWNFTALRVCDNYGDVRPMGCLKLIVNNRIKAVIPLVALANGEWLWLKIPLNLALDDVFAVESDTPITLALRGMYIMIRASEKAP